MYEKINKYCNECRQCREYEDESGKYYCRRSLIEIYDPEDSSACDRFEEDE